MNNSCFLGMMVSMAFVFGSKTDAAIVDSTQVGFTVKFEKKTSVDPSSLYSYFSKDIGQWWAPEHTWSGKSENLYIQLYIGGGFGEQMESGKSARHMDVIYIDPGKVLRMEGAIGPLQQYAVNGVMTLELKRESDSTRVSLTYAVGGYIPGGVSKYAVTVDQVVGQQFRRFLEYAEKKK